LERPAVREAAALFVESFATARRPDVIALSFASFIDLESLS
jgi:hypothetical protein